LPRAEVSFVRDLGICMPKLRTGLLHEHRRDALPLTSGQRRRAADRDASAAATAP
jgi:hypothetical protein